MQAHTPRRLSYRAAKTTRRSESTAYQTTRSCRKYNTCLYTRRFNTAGTSAVPSGRATPLPGVGARPAHRGPRSQLCKLSHRAVGTFSGPEVLEDEDSITDPPVPMVKSVGPLGTTILGPDPGASQAWQNRRDGGDGR